ncbi:SgcJ/EcaC family oxidoreductase [Sphaerisporangium sp. NPDC051017]|uniref:SgcJ/EcaC family oxidoreductase n=1 Tax=Sphaerisporangium sp. NPDC051017 TaxID=3154636 RepID=UPI00342B77F4
MGIHTYARGPIRLVLMGGLGLALTGAVTPAQAATGDGRAAPALSPMMPGTTDPDLTALAQLWHRQAEAWARGDGHAYGATYTPDADFVNVTGEHIHTGREIGVRFQRYLGAQLKDSRIITLEEKVQMLSPTLAYIIRKGCVFFRKETSCHPNTTSWNTSLVVKTGGQWLVRSFHNTLVKPPQK